MWTPQRLNDGEPVEYELGWELLDEPVRRSQ
jgi:hypothetical protein